MKGGAMWFHWRKPKQETQKEPPALSIRWMIRRDMPEVLEIEHFCFEFAWTEEDFLCCLRQRNCIGMVAERQKKIVGFMIYELFRHQLHVLNFAVAPWTRHQQVGAQMVDKLVHKLSQQRRHEILLEVRETNLAAQLFFHSQGFLASSVLRGYYCDTEEDAYVMRYRISEAVAAPAEFTVNKSKSLIAYLFGGKARAA